MSGKRKKTGGASFGKVSSSESMLSCSSSPAPTTQSTTTVNMVDGDPLPHEMACIDKSKPLEQLVEETPTDVAEQLSETNTTPSDTDSTDQADFDFRLSMLPEWAQKAALSRPSVAHMAASKGGVSSRKDSGLLSKAAGGKWEEVRGRF